MSTPFPPPQRHIPPTGGSSEVAAPPAPTAAARMSFPATHTDRRPGRGRRHTAGHVCEAARRVHLHRHPRRGRRLGQTRRWRRRRQPPWRPLRPRGATAVLRRSDGGGGWWPHRRRHGSRARGAPAATTAACAWGGKGRASVRRGEGLAEGEVPQPHRRRSMCPLRHQMSTPEITPTSFLSRVCWQGACTAESTRMKRACSPRPTILLQGAPFPPSPPTPAQGPAVSPARIAWPIHPIPATPAWPPAGARSRTTVPASTAGLLVVSPSARDASRRRAPAPSPARPCHGPPCPPPSLPFVVAPPAHASAGCTPV